METAYTTNYPSDGNMATLCFDCIYLRQDPLRCTRLQKELKVDNFPQHCPYWQENW